MKAAAQEQHRGLRVALARERFYLEKKGDEVKILRVSAQPLASSNMK